MQRAALVVEFHGDAIVLSGETGTKLKCETLGGYYPTWWGITSGGQVKNYGLSTAIVELNAGTGLDHIKDNGETILGSSGHALQLKMENPNTQKLKVVLVEEDADCFNHLKNVIADMWPGLKVSEAEGPPETNTTGVYLLKKQLPEALGIIETLKLGNSLLFFDPLLYTRWTEIDRVAAKRIRNYYHTQTEFIVFLFTTDWFTGRRALDLEPLPNSAWEAGWNQGQKDAVTKMDALFGNSDWRPLILKEGSNEERTDRLVEAYRKRLHKWFRYVLPLPFQPKENQVYHLFMCSNYEGGVAITKRFYADVSGNALPKMDSQSSYAKFKRLHPETTRQLSGSQRPLVWKLLWTTIRNHDEGLCDIRCQDFREKDEDWEMRLAALQWLEIMGYLRKAPQLTDAWSDPPPMYCLDWDAVKSKLGVEPPPKLVPLKPKG